MTLKRFEHQLQRYIPNFHIMESGYGDVAGAFIGRDYIFRLNKGEIQLYNHRDKKVVGKQPRLVAGHIYEEPIIKNFPHRGRMQTLQLLVNYRHLTQRQAQGIMWGNHVS